MPRKPSCTCGNCKTCAHRDYMRRWRDVVFPTLTDWERSVRNEVYQMTRYTCPLSVMTAAAYYVELREEARQNRAADAQAHNAGRAQ